MEKQNEITLRQIAPICGGISGMDTVKLSIDMPEKTEKINIAGKSICEILSDKILDSRVSLVEANTNESCLSLIIKVEQ